MIAPTGPGVKPLDIGASTPRKHYSARRRSSIVEDLKPKVRRESFIRWPGSRPAAWLPIGKVLERRIPRTNSSKPIPQPLAMDRLRRPLGHCLSGLLCHRSDHLDSARSLVASLAIDGVNCHAESVA
jgi:hypothetical protein